MWSYSLGVTLEKLVTTIDDVGDSTEQVKKCIKNKFCLKIKGTI